MSNNNMESKEKMSGVMLVAPRTANGVFVLDSSKLADFLEKKADSSSDVIRRFEEMTTVTGKFQD